MAKNSTHRFLQTVDASQVNKLLRELENNNDRKVAFRSGLRKSGNVIRNGIFRAMKSSHPKLGTPLYKRGIKTTVYKNASGVRVDIMGKASKADTSFFSKRNSSDKMYILKFFSGGTKPRYTKRRGFYKKRKSTGQIKASNFFERGEIASRFKAAITLQKNIETFIKRKANKKYGKSL